ncbi:NACHT domain-containing protein [Amycolatopsis vancoresmycina]|uniref:Signal transduction protein with Nacht domain n=1 Tax=Amycolatopsis vancoresmycina DSM 44592 TaxID=1292037 RepID=R1GGT9_9PSEU|nr:NACHT domain-containing protein [Amycolatopsis vancoresmycina]EOD70462.1 signal transduction protein with Nacht domain [Amycolatopsis vancoresmycina DSM 44592]
MTEEPANRITGGVIGSAVQVGALHGDMYVGVAPPSEPVFAEPPADWSSRPELPRKIVSLLQAQIRSAEKLPYRLRGARRPSLATVYVRQDVTTGTELQPSGQARPLPVLDSKGRLIDVPHPPAARLTVRPPSRSMREALDGCEHLLVTGGPGQGKSTLSLRLAADVARCWQEGADSPPLAEPVVPLRLTARELATRLELPFFEALAETVRGEYGAMLAQPLRPEDLTGRVAGCRWLLLVDGLDEVADAAVRDRLVTVLATWSSDEAYRVVLTTRPIEGATLAPFQRIGSARYELLPFDEEAFRRFAENWFAGSPGDARRFVRQIRDAHLRTGSREVPVTPGGSSARSGTRTWTSWSGSPCWRRSPRSSSSSTPTGRCRTTSTSCTRRTWSTCGPGIRCLPGRSTRTAIGCWSTSGGSGWRRTPR